MDDAAETESMHALIKDVVAIRHDSNSIITSRDEIYKFVEPSLVDACLQLWDLNIKTESSSANKADVGYDAYINLNYDSLSEENKIIAKENGLVENTNGMPVARINVPIGESTTIEEIQKKSLSFAQKFQKQKAAWIPSYSLQDLRKLSGYHPRDERHGTESFINDEFYYDSEGKRFYLSEEHFQKATEKVD